jgi:tetraacyldisaccharide 4'-kinase
MSTATANPRRRGIARGVPVISVGNLAMGGRGKTPVVALVTRHLLAAGERPAILSRGYGRRRVEEGAVIVSDGIHRLADLDRSGDEPLMLARMLPGAVVVVCERRAVAGRLAERALGASVHVLDDGFQHTSMARDADIVIVAPADLRDRRLPFGRLRSPVRALARAHAVIIDGTDGDEVRHAILTAARPASPAIFLLRRSLGAPAPIEPEQPWPDRRGPVVALAGIAEPARFAQALQGAGWEVARTVAFGDHHRYRRRDLETVASAVEETSAVGVLTTMKDSVRLLPLRPLPVPVAAVPLEVTIDPPSTFAEWLLGRLREVRA